MTDRDQSVISTRRERGRPTEWEYPEWIDASPEEIAEAVLQMPTKKRGQWRFEREAKGPA